VNASATIRFPDLPDSVSKADETIAIPAGECSDEKLLARVGESDKDALSQIFRRYASLVRGVGFRVLRDSSEADDLVQDVFLQIYRNGKSFDPARSPARLWILSVAYHCAISRRRYLTSRHFYTRLDLDDTASQGLAAQPASSAYEDSIDAALGSGALQKMFEGLSENQRDTLRLFFQEGYTLDEIAAKLDQSRENVKHHYFRGLERLRKQVFGSNWRHQSAV
jgi:RNA polymerase sigma-70 factor (ECF subfamily)